MPKDKIEQKIGDAQCDFRPGCSTADNLYSATNF